MMVAGNLTTPRQEQKQSLTQFLNTVLQITCEFYIHSA